MNAKEISDATLESVTPADNDLMLIYDTSEGTTGKATIAGIAPKVAENIDISTLPAVTPAADDVLMLRDTSAGTTGKATIADIIDKSSVGDIISLPSVQISNGTTGEKGVLTVKFLKLRSHRGIVFVDGSVRNSSPGTISLTFSIPNIFGYTILSIQGSESKNANAKVAYSFGTPDFYMTDCLGGDSTIYIRASLICDVLN